MAKDDSSNSFLSKLAKFVRNPTKDWSELDQRELEVESGYSKETLKEMIERKRQNDFVRKREFDHLRKLRRRDPHPSSDQAGRPSFFQSSLPTNPDERALTLRKIDEIEAQMSRQWWKSKQDESSPSPAMPAASAPGSARATLSPATIPGSAKATLSPTMPDAAPTEFPRPAPNLNGSRYAPKEALSAPLISEWPNQDMGFKPTEAYPGIATLDKAPQRPVSPPGMAAAASEEGTDLGALAVATPRDEPFAVELSDSITNPDLEDAAIRFANADYTGAEAGLVSALQGANHRSELVESWMTALFDLYRATGQKTRFDSAASVWARRFGRSAPVWFSIPEVLERRRAAAAMADAIGGADVNSKPAWASPLELKADDVAQLRTAVEGCRGTCVVDWQALRAITPGAVDDLGKVFAYWCDQTLKLEFRGYPSLDRALRKLTPSGDKAVKSNGWMLRLDAMRMLKQQDEFELVALEYCVTYEMSPPCWQDARCDCTLDPRGATQAVAIDIYGDKNLPAGLNAAPIVQTEIAGEIVGDPLETLANIDAAAGGVKQLVVSCDQLIRVDFSAAGSILNWVASHKAKGRQIQFTQVSSIVAAFFNVIGINEQARVVIRNG